jgi:Right handed beta helix region
MFCSKWYLVLAVLMVAIVPGIALGRMWHVEKDGSGDYTIIQDAIDAAAVGDTIQIGPGRFENYRTYSYPGGDFDSIIFNTRPGMTIIGAGPKATILGAENGGPGSFPMGAFNDVDVAGAPFSMSELAFDGGYFGALAQNGEIMVSNCHFIRCHNGFRSFASGLISGCRFENIEFIGVGAYSPGHDLTVQNCEFVRCSTFGFYFQASLNMSVLDCVFTECLLGGMFDLCAGSITGCSFTEMDPNGLGLQLDGSGEIRVANCVVEGGERSVWISGSNIVLENNVFRGASNEAFKISSCTPRINNNDILRDSGLAVLLSGFASNDEDLYIDMTNNYWGTTDADSIAAWIYDGNDEYDPIWGIKAFVDFEPFSAVPLDTKKESLGGFKSLYR